MRGLCKKGESCEFLHEYNLRKMPECNYWQQRGTCPANDDCPYQHIDPSFKRASCPHYERGFCPLGPLCANRHIRKDNICRYYLAGFCPNGRGCQEGAHPRFPSDLKKPDVMKYKSPEELEQEKEERERRAREEDEREEREQEERGTGGGRGHGQQQNYGRGGQGRGQWQGRRRRGPRGGKRQQF
jgi:cleavage and polyadenylation specificity factor subunit 4